MGETEDLARPLAELQADPDVAMIEIDDDGRVTKVTRRSAVSVSTTTGAGPTASPLGETTTEGTGSTPTQDTAARGR